MADEESRLETEILNLHPAGNAEGNSNSILNSEQLRGSNSEIPHHRIQMSGAASEVDYGDSALHGEDPTATASIVSNNSSLLLNSNTSNENSNSDSLCGNLLDDEFRQFQQMNADLVKMNSELESPPLSFTTASDNLGSSGIVSSSNMDDVQDNTSNSNTTGGGGDSTADHKNVNCENSNHVSITTGLQAEGEFGEDAENEEDTDKRSIYVGNVDYGATPQELQDHFKNCGAISRITIMVNKFNGHPMGYAYVEFAEAEAVPNAIVLSDTIFRGRQIKVDPKRKNIHGYNRGTRRGGFRGGGRGGGAAAFYGGGRGGMFNMGGRGMGVVSMVPYFFPGGYGPKFRGRGRGAAAAQTRATPY